MLLFVSLITLIIVTMISNMIQHRLFPHISASYFYMLSGLIIALVPELNQLVGRFDPEMFLGLIVAPLLFFEGQSMRMNQVARNWRLIISLTVIMVLIAALAATLVTKLFVGSLALATILGALSTPTDATASESVTNGLILPKREEKALKLESLFNDASGIILLNMGILWYVHGSVQVGITIWSFLYSAIGGIIVGFLLSLFTVWFSQLLIREPINFTNRDYNNTPVKVLYILTPFFIYFIAEEVGVSGIIAVVCAGLVHNAGAERSRLTNPEVLYDTSSIVNVIVDTLNGIVFVILGMAMIRFAQSKLDHPTLRWLWIGVALYLANLIVRYFYVRLVHHRDNKSAWIFALGGVHGAVTFALAYTIANTSGTTDAASLVIMSISVMIIISLLVPTFVFRFILPKQSGGKMRDQLVENIRQKMVQKAIDRINQIYLPEHLRRLVLFDLNAQKNDTTMREFTKQWIIDVRQPDLNDQERIIFYQAYRLAFRVELDYLNEIEQQDDIVRPAIIRLYREVLMAQILIFHTNN